MPQQKPLNPPDLTDVLNLHSLDLMKAINCVQIGILQNFYPATQTADIQIAAKTIIRIANDGTRILGDYPLLTAVPVMILTGGAGHLTLPITAGDTCMILFNDRQFDNWYISGQVQAPMAIRFHDKSDAMAIVGIRSLQNAISDYFEGARLQFDGTSKIELTHETIKMTGNVEITGSLQIDGIESGDGGTLNINSNLVQSTGKSIHAGNGANGTFSAVTVVDGIVISGTP